MNIHEYQAKELLQKFGVATPPGKAAGSPAEAERAAKDLGGGELVVKAQIHAGERGKGIFTNGFKGGVHLCKSPEEVRDLAAKMLGQTLVTHQTGPSGKVVNTVLVAKSVNIAREIYFAILVDRATAGPLIVASTEGGVEIETVAAKTPEKIIRESIPPLAGLQPFQARKLAKQLGFESSQIKAASQLFDGLYRTFIGLGNKEQAFAWLEKAYQERSNMIAYLKVLPTVDPLRSDPRFADLVQRVGLPP